jgi:cysteine desulfuration protein SufE
LGSEYREGMSLTEIQNIIVEEFSAFEDWLDKYDYLIELGNSLPAIDPAYKTDAYLIQGCQSKVWLNAEFREGRMYYTADSDAIIVKGIVALLIRVLNGQEASGIMNADLFFIDKIGLKENLSPTRSNGLLSMVKKMKLYALAYHTKHNAL